MHWAGFGAIVENLRGCGQTAGFVYPDVTQMTQVK
jgi:hypothetical protein